MRSRVDENLERVRERVAAAARRAGRDPLEVLVVGVTKGQPAEAAVEALYAGVHVFGENRVQEAAPKIARVAGLLHGLPPPEWHMVGSLQTNKAGKALGLFSMIQSVDSLRLAETLDRLAGQRPGSESPLQVLLEVYLGDDPGRPGLRPEVLPERAGQIAALERLEVRGLMTVAPLGWDAAAVRQVFARLRELQNRLASEFPRVHWHHLSMGMTDDFELAVEEGSTMVRIGRALFGPRK